MRKKKLVSTLLLLTLTLLMSGCAKNGSLVFPAREEVTNLSGQGKIVVASETLLEEFRCDNYGFTGKETMAITALIITFLGIYFVTELAIFRIKNPPPARQQNVPAPQYDFNM